jgi:phosphohistidine phosphatase SixA
MSRRDALLAFLLYPLLATGDEMAPPADASVFEQLRRGGFIIVFRHAATNRDQADTDPLNFDNVGRQRRLNATGLKAARQVGDALRAAHVPVGKVYTSKFNRAVVTGRLLSGTEVIPTLDVTEGGLVVTPAENERRSRALRRMAATPPDPATNTVIVTHKPNLLEAFGRDWFDVEEGEASVFKPGSSGEAIFVARLQVSDWMRAAR